MTEAHIKSPSYPSMSLADAVEGIKEIERLYRTTPVDREEAAKLMGYSGLNGAANKALSALSGYGLVERAGKGMMKVTPLTRSILHGANEAEKIQSLREAAAVPPLFQQIRGHFEGIDVPPIGGVQNLLNRLGFNSNAVAPAAKAFLETAEYLAELKESESDVEPDTDSVDSVQPNRPDPQKEGDNTAVRQKREVKPGMKQDIYTLPEGDVVLQWPERLSSDSFEEVKAWTELMLRKLKRQTSTKVVDDSDDLL